MTGCSARRRDTLPILGQRTGEVDGRACGPSAHHCALTHLSSRDVSRTAHATQKSGPALLRSYGASRPAETSRGVAVRLAASVAE